MSDPVKIVITAETAEAAAKLRAFLQTAGDDLKAVAKSTAHAAEAATTGLLAQNRMAVMELGHSARSLADGLMAGISPMRMMLMEAPRLLQSTGEMTAEMRAKIMGFLPGLGLVAAAIAAGAAAWHYYGDALVHPTQRAQEMATALEAIPELLTKIDTAQRAGSITAGQAQKYKDLLSQPVYFNQAPEHTPQGDQARRFHPSGTMFGPTVPDLTTDPYQRNPRTGRVTRREQDTNEADIKDFADYQLKHGGVTDANDKSQVADVALKKVAEQEKQIQRDAEVGLQKTIDRLKDRFEMEQRALAETRDIAVAAHKWTADDQAKYDAALAASKKSEAASIAEEETKAAKEVADARARMVQAQLESAVKMQEAAATQARNDLQQVEDQITADQDKAGHDRGALIQQEYKLRVAAAQSAFFSGEIAEEEYKHLVEEAAHKRTEAEKEYNAQLERTAALKRQISQSEAEAQLHGINQDNLTANEKARQSIPVWKNQMAANQADIGTQDQAIAAHPAGSDAALEAQEKKNALLVQQRDLLDKIETAQNTNSFAAQLDLQITKLRDTGTIAQQAAAAFGSAWTTAANSISNSVTGLVMGTKTWGQALRSVYNSIVTEVVHSLVQMAVQWTLQHTLMAAVSTAFQLGENTKQAAATAAQVGVHAAGEMAKTGATATGVAFRNATRLAETIFHGVMVALRVAAHIAGEIASTAVTLAQAAIRALAWLIQAAIGAMGAMANIPYVGPILAVVAAAGIVAAGMAMMGGFEAGGYTGDGPSGQVAGVVHRGEFVIPAHAVSRIGVGNLEAMKNGQSSGSAAPAAGGSGGSGVSIYAFTDPKAMAEHIQRNPSTEKHIVDVMGRNIHKFRS